jgi:dipeptidyl aminopeptidase/acylaminoacyl peptidase
MMKMNKKLDWILGLVCSFFLTGLILTSPSTAADIIEEKLSIKTEDGLTLSALLVKPAGNGPYPTIMVNHGSDGLREEWKVWIRKLAEKGYVSLALNFRGSPGSEGKETYGKKEVGDILLTIANLKTLPYVDKKNMGMFGFSKGGFNALLACTRTSDLKAVAVYGAWADMEGAYRYSLTQWNSPIPFMRDAAERHVKIIGGKPEAVPDEWKIRSAVNYVDNVTASILIFHGGKDQFVPANLVLPFAESLQRKGKNIDIKVYPEEEGHGLFLFTSSLGRAPTVSKKNAQDIWDRTLIFFDKNLKSGL